MDKELLYNASGAKDETAYNAIINVMKGNKEMGVMGVKKGEVWEVESGAATRNVVVIECFGDYAATIMLQDYEPNENGVKVIAHGIMYADTGRLGYVFYDKFVRYVRSLTGEEVTDLKEGVAKALDLEVNKVSAATAAAAVVARDKAYQEVEELHRNIAEAKEVIEKQEKELEEAYDHIEANAARVDELVSEVEELRKKLKEAPEIEEVEESLLMPFTGILEAGITEAMAAAREDLAAARKEAEIYKGLYEAMLARALG